MNLVIDNGNTCSKMAIFEQGEIVEKKIVDTCSEQTLNEWFDKYKIEKTILSTVVDIDSKVLSFLEKNSYLVLFTKELALPVHLCYQTPETLGVDRIAAVVGAQEIKPDSNLIVIDVGTCITYEVLTAQAEYLGGSISPGVDMRLKSLHDYTGRLPLIQSRQLDTAFGNDTTSAILTGVLNGIVYEIDGFIARLRQEYGEFIVFLTGGNTFFFEKRLKNRIFVAENLVLYGLNRILNYNV